MPSDEGRETTSIALISHLFLSNSYPHNLSLNSQKIPLPVLAHTTLILQPQLHFFPSKSASQNLKESLGELGLFSEGGGEKETKQLSAKGK